MAPSSSSTKRAARLAQKGKGKKVRFQGGTLFPLIVAAVLVFGLALIVYARGSRPQADESAPQAGVDHWHAAYAFQLCSDTADITLSGALEDQDSQGNLVSNDFRTTGVHSHDDGVIHWHPYGVGAEGRRAKVDVFLENYGVSLTDSELKLPEGSGSDRLSRLTFRGTEPEGDDRDTFPLDYKEGDTTCGGEDASLKVVVWRDYQDPSSNQRYINNFDQIPFDQDNLVIVIAFVPDDVDVVLPEWTDELPTLGAADSAAIPGVAGTAVVDTSSDGTANTTDGTVTDDTATEDTATEDTRSGDTTVDTASDSEPTATSTEESSATTDG